MGGLGAFEMTNAAARMAKNVSGLRSNSGRDESRVRNQKSLRLSINNVTGPSLTSSTSMWV
jgi:hypothetical protein